MRRFSEVGQQVSKIRRQFRDHPDVLAVRWVVAANTHQWAQALSLAKDICRLAPDKPSGWSYQASSLIELKRCAEAYEILQDGHRRFPDDEMIAYDLGCVCCCLSRQEEAFSWIRKAIDLGGFQVERRAIADPELLAMWTKVGIR